MKKSTPRTKKAVKKSAPKLAQTKMEMKKTIPTTKKTSPASPKKSRAKAKVETTMDSPREPSKDLNEMILVKPKEKISRKSSGDYRERQRAVAQPHSVNPFIRR